MKVNITEEVISVICRDGIFTFSAKTERDSNFVDTGYMIIWIGISNKIRCSLNDYYQFIGFIENLPLEDFFTFKKRMFNIKNI